MTPEERATGIEIVREIAKESPADGLLLSHSIAAAIRAAVAEFRERVAKVAERTGRRHPLFADEILQKEIAKAIRELE